MASRVVLAAGLIAVVLGQCVGAQETGAPPVASATSEGKSPRVVKRSVLPDGTIQFEYSDGTTRRDGSPLEQTSSPPQGRIDKNNDLAPVGPPEWLKDPAVNRAFLDSVHEYYVYRGSGLRYRSRVFEWQLFSSRVIFATVILLVGSGIVFAAIQFRAGLKRPSTAAQDAATEIGLSAGSVKVSSPVLGVIILVISLGFFYLYLVYVYPISEII